MILDLGNIYKAPYEEVFRTCQFKRPDGAGWLDEGVEISAADVVVMPASGGDPITSMIDFVAPYDTTQVRYRLSGGTAGQKYLLRIRIIDSNNQMMEARANLLVI